MFWSISYEMSNKAKERSFNDVLSLSVRRIINSWAVIVTMVGLLGSVLGLVLLYTYTYTIGRPELFMIALDSKAALFAWVVLAIAFVFLYSVIMAITSISFAFSVSILNIPPERQNRFVLWLLIPVVTGFVAFALMLFKHPEVGGFVITAIVAVTLIIVCCGIYFLSSGVRGTVRKQIVSDQQSRSEFIFRTLGFCGALLFLLLLTVFAGVNIIMMTLRTYTGEDSQDAIYYLASISFLSMTLTLVPIVVFYLKRGDVYERLFYCSASSPLIVFVLLLMSPGVLGHIAYRTAGVLGMRQACATRIALSDDLQLNEFSRKSWDAENYNNGKLNVSAFSLFSFGNVLLLCPESLLSTERKNWPNESQACILTESNKTFRLPSSPKLDTAYELKQGACLARLEYSPIPLKKSTRRVCLWSGGFSQYISLYQ